MKVARFVLKIVGWSLALAAAVCCVVAYWDKITSSLCCLKDKLSEMSTVSTPEPLFSSSVTGFLP